VEDSFPLLGNDGLIVGFSRAVPIRDANGAVIGLAQTLTQPNLKSGRKSSRVSTGVRSK
jgi:hypothetical protein